MTDSPIICIRCGDPKIRDEMVKNSASKTGIRGVCKKCVAKTAKKEYQKYNKPPPKRDPLICTKCGNPKKYKEMTKDNSKLLGIKSHCILCVREQGRKDYTPRQAKEPEKVVYQDIDISKVVEAKKKLFKTKQIRI
jgi:hypothetical protein